MTKPSLADILALSLPERVRYAQALWDSISQAPDSVPLTPSEREEIARRLEAYYRDPKGDSPWAEVLARVRARAGG